MSVSRYIIKDRTGKYVVCFVVLFSVASLLPSCEILEIEHKVIFETGEVLVAGANNAIVSGIIYDPGKGGLDQHGHCWSLEREPTVDTDTCTSLGGISTFVTYNSLLTGLAPDTVYYVKAYVSDQKGTYYGEEIVLRTAPRVYDLYMPTTSEAVAGYSPVSIVVDGNDDEPGWEQATPHACTGSSLQMPVPDFSPSDLSCAFKVMFNEQGLMFWISVKDQTIITYEDIRGPEILSWMADYAEIYLHIGDYPTPDGAYTEYNTFQIRFNPYYSSSALPSDIDSISMGRNGYYWKPLDGVYSHVNYVVVPSDKGYNVEAFISWDLFADRPDHLMYFEVQAADTDDPVALRESIIAWNNTDFETRKTELAWNNSNFFGRLFLYKQNP
jgi:hypothetical protein